MSRRVSFGILFLVLVVVGIFVVSPPQFIREWGLPKIARDLPVGTTEEISAAFDARVKEHYPTGITEGNFLNTLRAENFEVVPGEERVARIERGGHPCTRSWTIVWLVNPQGQIADVGGRYDVTCP